MSVLNTHIKFIVGISHIKPVRAQRYSTPKTAKIFENLQFGPENPDPSLGPRKKNS